MAINVVLSSSSATSAFTHERGPLPLAINVVLSSSSATSAFTHERGATSSARAGARAIEPCPASQVGLRTGARGADGG